MCRALYASVSAKALALVAEDGLFLRVGAEAVEPLVSIDFNHNSYSSNFDANHTRVQGRLVKVLAWYDNEWGFSNRMLDTGVTMATSAMKSNIGVAA